MSEEVGPLESRIRDLAWFGVAACALFIDIEFVVNPVRVTYTSPHASEFHKVGSSKPQHDIVSTEHVTAFVDQMSGRLIKFEAGVLPVNNSATSKIESYPK